FAIQKLSLRAASTLQPSSAYGAPFSTEHPVYIGPVSGAYTCSSAGATVIESFVEHPVASGRSELCLPSRLLPNGLWCHAAACARCSGPEAGPRSPLSSLAKLTADN